MAGSSSSSDARLADGSETELKVTKIVIGDPDAYDEDEDSHARFPAWKTHPRLKGG